MPGAPRCVNPQRHLTGQSLCLLNHNRVSLGPPQGSKLCLPGSYLCARGQKQIFHFEGSRIGQVVEIGVVALGYLQVTVLLLLSTQQTPSFRSALGARGSCGPLRASAGMGASAQKPPARGLHQFSNTAVHQNHLEIF